MEKVRKVLVTGGAGWVGLDWTPYLLERGYEVRVLDVNVEPLRHIDDSRLMLIQSGVEDRDAVRRAMEGVDAVVHLAWSFSSDPLETVQTDLVGHIYVLEEAVSQKVSHLRLMIKCSSTDFWLLVKHHSSEKHIFFAKFYFLFDIQYGM